MAFPSRVTPFAAVLWASTTAFATAQEEIWRVTKSTQWESFGSDASLISDLTGDGVPEVLVAAPGTQTIYGFDGTTGAELFTVPNPGTTAFAECVEALRDDANGDGIEDFLADSSAGSTTTVYLFSGSDRTILLSFVVSTPGVGITTFDTMSDLDGDGIRDIAMGFAKTV